MLGPGPSTRLEALAGETRTTCLRGPGRVAGTLADLAEACGADRQIVVAREPTKPHEEIWKRVPDAAVAGPEHSPSGVRSCWCSGGGGRAASLVSDDILTGALVERSGQGERTLGVVEDVAALSACRGSGSTACIGGSRRSRPAFRVDPTLSGMTARRGVEPPGVEVGIDRGRGSRCRSGLTVAGVRGVGRDLLWPGFEVSAGWRAVAGRGVEGTCSCFGIGPCTKNPRSRVI